MLTTMILRACPICGADKPKILLSLRMQDFVRMNRGYHQKMIDKLEVDEHQVFRIGRCTDCGFQYAMELLPDGLVGRLYEQCIDHEASRFKIFSKSRVIIHHKRWATILAHVTTCGADKLDLKLLDYGCGWGDFLEAAQSPGVSGYGVEQDRIKIAWARERGLEIHEDEQAVASAGSYDVIHAHQVLEHVPDPRETVHAFCRWLKPGGLLFVSVPMNSEGMREAVRNYHNGQALSKNVNPWEHLNYFTPKSLAALLLERGFTVCCALDDKPTKMFRQTHRKSTSLLCRYEPSQ